MVKMEIKGLLMDPVSNMPVVVLRDAANGVFLPIWVGIFEANAIALQMEKITTPRPMISPCASMRRSSWRRKSSRRARRCVRTGRTPIRSA